MILLGRLLKLVYDRLTRTQLRGGAVSLHRDDFRVAQRGRTKSNVGQRPNRLHCGIRHFSLRLLLATCSRSLLIKINTVAFLGRGKHGSSQK